ncbi:hypothetical protein A2V68_02415 [candidate division Kazan bacterium RBG_13_50_9]|uniref:Mannosyl-glycoprotein endo-beta-N-acetylglucosamidase-like domain-containing protein n=1 Tax=candidate division Kazan bacterium RBG_13_50_9 TaxID=1798535 RepID=A0A1F4NRF7_UNCK3|nr:MAG: hypothetical protein A2V68_02415 [candidate division Kazan bacterium RBG_13_50_9]
MGGLSQFIVGILTILTLSSGPSAPAVDPMALASLSNFLVGRNSPLPAEELLKYDNWEMIVALSCAESGYGTKLGGEYNAWGIKDYQLGSSKFGRTRDFGSWAESIEFTSELLYKYDPEDGEPAPRGMVRSWKSVRPYEHWIGNVEYALRDIRANVLV